MTHGLRKAAARRLAEAGCTEKQIAAITGHTTLKEIARYQVPTTLELEYCTLRETVVWRWDGT